MPRVAIAAFLVGALVALGVAAIAGAFQDDGDGPDQAAPVSGPLGERANAIYGRSRDAVVFIQARVQGQRESPFGNPRQGQVATGSGFLYDDRGHIVTNAHVVEDAADVAIQSREGRLLDARVVGTDLSTDLAVIRVDPGDLDAEPLPLAEEDGVEVGDPVLAMGNPLGLEDTITSGIVSALQRRITAPNGFAIEGAIQSDAAINPGNSGGPLLDSRGRVIGVNSQIATAGSRGFIGIGFAVPSGTVRSVVPRLISDGEVERPFLGVSTTDVTPSIAARLGLSVERGALVTSVAPGSPADRAGLRAGPSGPAGAITGGGDVIVGIAGQEVRSAEDLVSAVEEQQIGERVQVRVVRGDERITRPIVIGDRPG